MTIKKTCFFIDDDAENLNVFTKALTYVTPETICFAATNGKDALILMEEEEIIPSCIFVKLYLHEMCGDEFLRIVKSTEFLKEVPVIVHASDPESEIVDELKALGATAIYTKSFSFHGVCNMLNLYFPPEIAGIGQN